MIKARNDDLRAKLLAGGVHNLKQFGYPTVNDENIMTDYVYREFFKSMLKEQSFAAKSSRNGKVICTTCDQMVAEIEALDKLKPPEGTSVAKGCAYMEQHMRNHKQAKRKKAYGTIKKHG